VFETSSGTNPSNLINLPNTVVTLAELAPGDFVLLYLAQDGTFDASDSLNWGNLQGATNAGVWQVNRVASRVSTTVIMECDLNPAFVGISFSGPYFTAVMTKIVVGDVVTLLPSASFEAVPWGLAGGSATNVGGGVVAIVANKILMSDNSRITTDGAGFSGGLKKPNNIFLGCGLCLPGCLTTNYVCSDWNGGGMKGASIAPYSEDLSNRQYCRGATANGGGGGDNHGSAGGGGANVCADSGSKAWTGDGVSVSFLFFSCALSKVLSRLKYCKIQTVTSAWLRFDLQP